jgi:hypothetical protein
MHGEERDLMSRDPRAGEAGIVLPPDLLQPFLLRFRREELHVMAFFSGHSDYEAVEAMVSYRDDGTPSIRAILTRHDQSQIDHVNDDDLSAEGHGVARQTCRRDIALAIDALPGRRHARLEFRSHADEPVVLDITTVGEPDPKRGGISDPGSHSPDSSLPLMRRRASTLAGPQTAVFVGGKRFEVPVKIRSGPFVAHEGYFTEGHAFGAIRAGTISYRLKDLEVRLDPAKFIRLGRGVLANVDVIVRVTPMPGGLYTVRLQNGQELDVSRIQSRLLRTRLLQL